MDDTVPTPETEALPEPVSELNLDTMPKAVHHWVDRGLVWSCETTSHPYHQTGKRQVPMQQQ